MRTIPAGMWTLWEAGGPFIGDDGAPHGRVTVEPSWFLTEAEGVGTYDKTVRWYQRANNSQTEVEIPSIKSIETDRSVDAPAATCTITLYNQAMKTNLGAQTNLEELGNPGYYTPGRGASPESLSRWGHTPNTWADVLVPNCLIRTYQGFGGRSETIANALSAGNIILTGVWLVDRVRVSSNGMITLTCRDMCKLLIEQPIYPPLAPTDPDPDLTYPHTIEFYRWHDVITDWLDENPYGEDGVVPGLIVTGIEKSPSGSGYWILGSDGGVFSMGNTQFHGSRGDVDENAPTVSMAATYTGDGYWLVGADGGIFSFGDAEYHGTGYGVVNADVVEIEAHSTEMGYWLAAANGTVYAFGAADYHGGGLTGNVVGLAVMPNNEGYWLVNDDGEVAEYGAAAHYGDSSADVLNAPITGIESTPSGLGYFLVGEDGGVFTYGDAEFVGGAADIALNDPMCDMVVNAAGTGYWLVAEDGGVFSFGAVSFHGSLVDGVSMHRTDGNYLDYVDIVKLLLLWAGFWLYKASPPATFPEVYGNLESTGAYCPDELAVTIFDKQPVIDAINTFKEIVGYLFWIDDEGAARFESPNFWAPGNFMDTGAYTSTIPELDETLVLIDYTTESGDQVARSEIIITTDEPTANLEGTRTARKVPPSVALCRGMSKPMMYGVPVVVTLREQELMAELFAIHMRFQERFGSVTAAANPAIQINDQVRIFERQSSETYIHYVRGVSTSMDLDAGHYTMTLTTHWLGDETEWAIEDADMSSAMLALRTAAAEHYMESRRLNSQTVAVPLLTTGVRFTPRIDPQMISVALIASTTTVHSPARGIALLANHRASTLTLHQPAVTI